MHSTLEYYMVSIQAYVQSTRITTTRVVVSVNQLELGFTEEWEFLLANDSLNLNSTEFFFFCLTKKSGLTIDALPPIMAVQKSAAAVTVRRVKGFNSVKSLLLLLVASNEIGAFQINSPTIRTPLAGTAYSIW